MKPRPLNLAAAVSLLLAVAIVVLWVRGYGRHEVIQRLWYTSTELRVWLVESRHSELSFESDRNINKRGSRAPNYRYFDFSLGNLDARHWFPFPPVGFKHSSIAGSWSDTTELTVAYWLLLPPTLVLPAIAFVRHRRRRLRQSRLAKGHCLSCGYDLRAQSAGDRCPECGTVPASGAFSPIA